MRDGVERRACGAGRRGSRKDPAVFGARGLWHRRRRNQESVRQPRHFFDELVAQPLGISRSREMLDVIGESSDDGDLCSKTGKLELRSELAVVVRFQCGERGHVGEHRLGFKANAGPARFVGECRGPSARPRGPPRSPDPSRVVGFAARCAQLAHEVRELLRVRAVGPRPARDAHGARHGVC